MKHPAPLLCVILLACSWPIKGQTLLAVSADSSANASPQLAATSRHRTATVPCRAIDNYAADFRDYVDTLLTSTDTPAVSVKDSSSLIPVDLSRVYYVTDLATCDRGARAHARAAGQDTINPPAISLLRVGPTRYVAFNGVRYGEFLVHFVFDSSFVLLDKF